MQFGNSIPDSMIIYLRLRLKTKSTYLSNHPLLGWKLLLQIDLVSLLRERLNRADNLWTNRLFLSDVSRLLLERKR